MICDEVIDVFGNDRYQGYLRVFGQDIFYLNGRDVFPPEIMISLDRSLI
jgi:hypothetical protein